MDGIKIRLTEYQAAIGAALMEGVYTDHGPIFYKDGTQPSYVNAVAVGNDGFVYALARFSQEGKEISDLIKIPDPLISR